MELQKNKIFHMDCMAFMRRLPDGYVHLILTDPPYGIRYQNRFTRETLPHLDGDAGIDYMEFAAECHRILQNNSHAYFFTRYDKYPYHYECLTQAGFTVKNCLVIEKGHIGGIGDLYGSYANNCEWIIFCHKGRRLFNRTMLVKNTYPAGRSGGAPKAVYKTRFNCCWFGDGYPKSNYNSAWRAKHGLKHPAIKNVECLEWLIQLSSDPGSIVFDPFMGSGSTAIAAQNTGRYYLGTETDGRHYQLSVRRVQSNASESRGG